MLSRYQSRILGGWWKGEILEESGTKRVGNFPSNYVTVLGKNRICYLDHISFRNTSLDR